MLTEDTESKLKEAFLKYYSKNTGAYLWLQDFRGLCHGIDDLVDIPERRNDAAFFGGVCNQFVEVLSSDFYVTNRAKLYSMVKSCLHQFFLSVKWENSDLEWQQTYADIVRCCYNNVIAAVTEIVVLEETGSIKSAYEAAQEIYALAVCKSYQTHHTVDGKPI